MTIRLNATRALIFRITHIANVAWILRNGLHSRNSGVRDPNFIRIGNPELIQRRATRPVPVPPGGTLSDYVPFYFHSVLHDDVQYTGRGRPQIEDRCATQLVFPMIKYAKGNLLAADVEAVVNTVNTVGIMGKGIALMFKERFPRNFEYYTRACEVGGVRVGKMFVTENEEFFGPRWIINFPTKTHWRVKTKIEWVTEGLEDLVRVIRGKNIRSIAIPPLGCGNGGLHWDVVRPLVLSAFEALEDVDVIIYEPTASYPNVAKRTGVDKLTPARALITEMVRRYSILGIDCSILELQKLAWFIDRGVKRHQVNEPLKFNFRADRYGPYSQNLMHLLNDLDGSYLRCDKRIADAGPNDLISFNEEMRDRILAYIHSDEGKEYLSVLEWASATIDGFESPLGMELLATVDWMIQRDGLDHSVDGVMDGLKNWAGGSKAGQRKMRIFDERLVSIAVKRLEIANLPARRLIVD